MNKNFDIKKYLQTVYSLESSLYELKNVRQMLNNKINTYRKGLSILNTTAYNSDGTLDEIGTLANIYTLEETPFYNLKKEESMPRFFWYFDSEFLTTAICLAGATSIIYIIFSLFFLNDIWYKRIAIIFSDLSTLIVFVAAVLVIYTIYTFYKYFSSVKKTKNKNEKIKQENIEINKNNQKYLKIQNKIQKKLEEEVVFLNSKIIETEDLLKKYYEMNIIFSKYRNLICISSINEYFESGRCKTLEGHEGAYNILENEIRLNLIINKLDNILEKLDQIKEHQYMLYAAIQHSNNIIQTIGNEIKIMNNQIEAIENNSSIAAYNSQITTNNSEFLKYYMILRG